MKWPKNDRQERILQVLGKATHPLSITEIDNELYFLFELQTSRRTVDRDLRFLCEIGLVEEILVKAKKRYSKKSTGSICLTLSEKEYAVLMKFLESATTEELIALRNKFKE